MRINKVLLVAAWLFCRTWLGFAGADDTDIPTF
jgi:hypothetical protein